MEFDQEGSRYKTTMASMFLESRVKAWQSRAIFK